jgi:hypothetical protein
VLAIDGVALNPGQQQQDDARIGRLMKDPRPVLKLKQAEDEDELKLQRLLSLMPQAFVYEMDGVEENLMRVKFRPNPDYNPPTYEARVIHSLAGTVLIDADHKRLARVAGQLMNRVEFGYGLLGRIDSGSVEFERVEVGPQQWKTALINIHFSGQQCFDHQQGNMSGARFPRFPTISASPTQRICFISRTFRLLKSLNM